MIVKSVLRRAHPRVGKGLLHDHYAEVCTG